MPPFDLKQYLAERRGMVDRSLEACLEVQVHSRVRSAMHYSLMAGGKRLRPILCMAGCEAAGGSISKAIPVACALEMIHTYSLIHDDLPAMDNDPLRRGKPTCHVAFDEATAILAGDGLLTFSFEILSEKRSDIDPLSQLAVIGQIARSAGIQGMVEGQMRDMEAQGRKMDTEALTAMHRLKTGALIEASVCTGALVGGAEKDALERFRLYGQNIGLAFQVVDDILNVVGQPGKLGKPVGTDADREKATYPSLLGLESSRALARRLVDEAIECLSEMDSRSQPLRALAGYILERDR